MEHVIETMRSWLAGEPVWPFAKIIETWGPEFENYRQRWAREWAQKVKEAEDTGKVTFRTEHQMRRTLDRGVKIYQLRDIWVKEFGFAIPCAELLDELALHRQVVEVGAGTGYMTRLMMHRGINVIGSNPDRQDYSFKHGIWDEAGQVDADAKTMVRRYPDATIFCSWPTLNHTWFRQMLHAMRIGQKLVVIKEDACAEGTAWQYLDDCFEELSVIHIPTFEHMNDYASVHVKKRNRVKADGTAMQP